MKAFKHKWSVIMVAVGMFWNVLHASGAESISLFSKLPSTDVLRVSFSTQGCFHGETYEFLFRRAAVATVSVVRMRMEWAGDEQKSIRMTRKKLGEVVLTEADLKGLDNLLGYHRSSPRGGCTTVDTITMTQIHDGQVLATEGFIDGSCATPQMRDVTSFSEMVRRAQKQ